MKVKIGKYVYEKSDRKNKKLMTIVDGKKVHFGNLKPPANQHFKDKTGIHKSLDHNDPKRRKNYLTRTAGIKNKENKLTKDLPSSANYHARRILW